MNVVLVFADQMRGQSMACAGDQQVRTPNLDRLAAEGVRVSGAYSNTPVCTPARGTLLTGLWPLRHGAFVNDVPIRPDTASLGTIFRDAGHACGYIGKWHLDGVPRGKFTPPGPRRLGFDDFWAVHNCIHRYFESSYYTEEAYPIPIRTYEPEHQTDLALAFIEAHRRRPFCLVVSYGTPHNPYQQVPQRYKDLYPVEDIRLRPNVPPEHAPQAREDLSGYYAHITALDEQVARIVADLDRLGLSEETLLVFTSDHGDMLGSLGSRRKQQPWEESISIPMIFRQPRRLPAGHCPEGLMGLLDLMPTILGLTGMPAPAGVQGVDLSKMLLGRATGREDVLLADFAPVDEAEHIGVREWRGLRTRQYTYARNVEGPWVLIDNHADPYQQANLVAEPAMREVLDNLDRRLSDRLAAVDDELLPWDELMRRQGAVDLWNQREEHMHHKKAKLL